MGEIYKINNERNDGQYSVEKTLSIATMRFNERGNGAEHSSLRKYKVLRLGDLAFEGHTNKIFRYGRFVLNNLENGIMSPRFTTLRPLIKQDFNFWEYYIHSERVMRSRLVKATKAGTMMNELVPDDLFCQDIFMPSILEQKQIGQIIKKLDHLITLHQRKCEKLEMFKKSMLEKMFPKNGESIPELRFKGFTDAWEQRKLNEIYKKIRNAFVGTATPYYVKEGHFYLESNNIKNGQINTKTQIFINDVFYQKQKDKWLHTGDMVMVQSGHVGHAAIIPPELDNVAAHALIMFQNKQDKNDPYFLNYELQTNKAKAKIFDITTGNTIKHILASDMQEFIVDTASYEEQKKITKLFFQIDHLITLYQRKVEKLQQIKKSLLEKMFVS